MAKLTKKRLLNLTPDDIGKMKGAQLRETLRGARQLFNAQASTFGKYQDKVYSHSLRKMNEYYFEYGREKVVRKDGVEYYSTVPQNMSHMTDNKMKMELFRLQEFFESKTSTVPGAKKVTADMARRIFGQTKSGRPKDNLTVEQWQQFWDLYDEYKAQNPADTFEQSNLVQQSLGQMVQDYLDLGKMPSFGQSSLDEIRKRVEYRQKENWEKIEENNGNTVFSGTRPY